jgi:fructose-1,6-bisphosphatase/inositol monophosphatase family enzyme
MPLEEITDALLNAARAGAAVCVGQRLRCTVSFKPHQAATSPHVALAAQIVTSADLAVQETILQSLLDSGFEGCALEAEEDTASVCRFKSDPNAPTIFIDPIDGTLAYSIGCPGWKEAADRAGFPESLFEQTKSKTNIQLYGMVLGASVPNEGIVAICGLPELAIMFHTSGIHAFRNGAALNYPRTARQIKVAIGRRLLDPQGETAMAFTSAVIDVRWFNGSAPGVLWQMLEGDCTGYAGLKCAFDVQLAALVAQRAGFLVTDRNGRSFVPDLRGIADSIVVASTPAESARICDVLQQYR